MERRRGKSSQSTWKRATTVKQLFSVSSQSARPLCSQFARRKLIANGWIYMHYVIVQILFQCNIPEGPTRTVAQSNLSKSAIFGQEFSCEIWLKWEWFAHLPHTVCESTCRHRISLMKSNSVAFVMKPCDENMDKSLTDFGDGEQEENLSWSLSITNVPNDVYEDEHTKVSW